MPASNDVLTDEILEFVMAFKDSAGISSKSKTVNYLIYLGAQRVIEMPNFKDLKLPLFDLDMPKKQLEATPSSNISDPLTPPKSEELADLPLTVLRSSAQIEELFKTIPHYEKIPESSKIIIKMRLAYKVDIDPEYDGEFIYDIIALNSEHILKKLGRNLKWHWREEKSTPEAPAEKKMM